MLQENEELYQEIIQEHSRRPRNKGVIKIFTHSGVATQPSKGSAMKVYLRMSADRLEEVSFEGEGSAIAVASASLMTQAIVRKNLNELIDLDAQVRKMLTQECDVSELGELAAISGIRMYPARIDCALLAWNALKNALSK